MSAARAHLPLGLLLDYWLHDTDAAATDAVDEHLIQCDGCGADLDGLIALGDGVRAALRAGEVTVAVGAAFARRLAERGARVRQYRLPHNGSVHCTVEPDDDFVVTWLDAPLQGVRRLDVRTEVSNAPEARHEQRDVPFDAGQGAVVFVSTAATLRPLPAHTRKITLLAVDAGSVREVGRYTFRHTPFPDRPRP